MRIPFLFILLSPLFGDSGFNMIVLGSGGGPLEDNMTSYMVAPSGSDDYVTLDAGSLLGGLYKAKEHLPEGPVTMLRNHIKAYLITHAHLDHVAGLVVNSTIDTKKPIYGLPSTINFIRDNLFNWKIWPNFGSEGNKPLNQYDYKRLNHGEKTELPNANMSVTAYPLSHPDGYISTAYLLQSKDDFLLFFGDTSPDAVEKKNRIFNIWKQVYPLVKEKKLRHIFLECSYTNQQPTSDLFGHLTPKFWTLEFQKLALLIDPNNPQSALNGLHTYVIHVKQPPFVLKEIEKELETLNSLGLIIHFPKQGEKLKLE